MSRTIVAAALIAACTIASANAADWVILDMSTVTCVKADEVSGVGGTPDEAEHMLRQAKLFKAKHVDRAYGKVTTVTIEMKDGREILYFPDPEICEMTRSMGLATGDLKPTEKAK